MEIVHQMNELAKQRDTLHTQLTSFQHVYEQLQDENTSLKDEVNQTFNNLSLAFSLQN